jgi:tetratricopeptide (TPR) repeat protein
MRRLISSAIVFSLAACASAPSGDGGAIAVQSDRIVEAALAAWVLAGDRLEPGSLREAAAADLAPLAGHALAREARAARRAGESLNGWIGRALDRADARSPGSLCDFLESGPLRAYFAAAERRYARAVADAAERLPLSRLAAAARREFAIGAEESLDVVVSMLAPEALGIAIERPGRRIAVVSPRLAPGGLAERGVRERFELAGVVLHELAHRSARRAVESERERVAALERRLGALAASGGRPFPAWLEENLASAAACVALRLALGDRDARSFAREEERRGLVLVPVLWREADRVGSRALFEKTGDVLDRIATLDPAPLDRRARLAADLRDASARDAAALHSLVERYPDDAEPCFALAEALYREGRLSEARECFREVALLREPADLARDARERLRRIASRAAGSSRERSAPARMRPPAGTMVEQ